MSWTGVFAPVPTPFDAEDRVDPARMRSAFSRWLKSPLTGFVVLGSNGEAALLDEGESDLVVATARELVPRGRPLVVGTGRESTQAAIRAARRAADLGADAVLVRTPGFFKSQMTSAVFVRHYTAVADASPVPVLLYNFTAVTGVTLQPDAVAKLAAHPNIAGMKESGGDIAQIAELISVSGGQAFSVLAGSASTFYAALGAGVSEASLPQLRAAEACVRLFD
jgi:4-hydroxy-2-oxoglutarate aldolase